MSLVHPLVLPALLLTAILVVWLVPSALGIISDYSAFFLLGITGAIFANSTGAGGGVVFIPIFNQLGFSEVQSVATSFGIQCFGMTAGAITWCLHYRREKAELHLWQCFTTIIAVSAVCSISGIWTVYGANLNAPASVHEVFSLFSIVLGLAILTTVYLLKPGRERSHLLPLDAIALAVIAYVGGIFTAWLSVGVGEMMAFYLILRRYDVMMAVAAAVVVTALTVWAAAPEHFLLNPNAYWQVLVFAGPGAVIGGIVARSLVGLLSARRLKAFFGFWVLIIGLAGLPSFFLK